MLDVAELVRRAQALPEPLRSQTISQIELLGWRKQRAAYELDLRSFAEACWPLLEGGRTLSWNWHLTDICYYLSLVRAGRIRRLILNVPPRTMKSLLVNVIYPAWMWTTEPHHQFLCLSNADDLALRDAVKCRRIVESDWYYTRWGERGAMLRDGQREKSYYETVEGGHRVSQGMTGNLTGKGGDTVIIDDPHDAEKAQSDVERQNVLERFDTKVYTRQNQPNESAIILIMQRLHQSDLTGHLLKTESEKVYHYVAPMRYEGRQKGKLKTSDPRKKKGTLLWPERFTESTVRSWEEKLGTYGCNPYEAPILMADLSMRPIGRIKVGDEIVGFERRQRPDGKGRMRLVRATVTAVHVRTAPVVKMTLDSGHVIRCTRDHRWYTKTGRGVHRPDYLPVTLGRSRLARICPPSLPELNQEDERLAGWVSGFFDGEGTVSQGRRYTGHEPSTSVAFFQGAGRNLPLCEKLESALHHFGFPFTYTEDERKDNKAAACYGYRHYRLKDTSLPMLQRFLHIVQPTKWRERLVKGAYRAQFIRGREKVLSIEPDGEEPVYALTTTTGNYVVWGLASANSSGQLQQRPSPAGGGILKEEWWQPWVGPLPYCEHIFQSWDTAFSEADVETNSRSARTDWGVFWHEQLQRWCSILVGKFAESVDYPTLRREARVSYKKLQPDAVVIEKKASGQSLIQDLKRAHVPVHPFNPDRDKVSRAYAVQAVFESGLVFVPCDKDGKPKAWTREVIEECAVFPKGERDDLVDTVTQAMLYIRRLHYLTHPDDTEYVPPKRTPTDEEYEDDQAAKRKTGRRGAYG